MRRFISRLGFVIGLAAFLGGVMVFSGRAAEPTEITIASLSPGTAWYVYGATVADLLRPKLPPGSKVEVLPQSGGIGNAKLLAQGKANFAFSFTLTNRWAFQGRPPYDSKLDMLRGLVGGLDTYYLAVVVRSDAGISSLADLKEKKGKVSLGTLAVGSAGEYGARNLLEVLGMSYDDIKKAGGNISHTNYPTMITAMKDGRMNTVIAVITPGHPSITEMALESSLRFLPMPPDVVTKMQDGFGYRPQTMARGMFRGMDQDVPTVGFPTVFIARADVPDDLAYLVTKTICENKPALVAAHKGLSHFEPGEAWKPDVVGLPLHPGAVKFYREKGWMK
jgi:TRAP transporter TAXI family solute receptor